MPSSKLLCDLPYCGSSAAYTIAVFTNCDFFVYGKETLPKWFSSESCFLNASLVGLYKEDAQLYDQSLSYVILG